MMTAEIGAGPARRLARHGRIRQPRAVRANPRRLRGGTM